MKKNVVIVDNNESTRKELVRLFKEKDCEVLDYSSGESLLEDYYRLKPDLIVVDMEMPGMNGNQCAKEILEQDPSAYIVMSAATVKKETIVESIKLHAKGFLIKPILDKHVEQTLQNMEEFKKIYESNTLEEEERVI